jgi:putative ATP-binding cassette transporter
VINGFKEIKINNHKANAILQNISEVSLEAKGMKIEAGRKEARMWGFGRIFVYALLPIFVFIIPSFSSEHAADVFKVTSIVLFIIGPITILVNMIPIISRVNLVIQEMTDLEEEMDLASTPDEVLGDTADMSFQHIRLKDLQFNYPDNDASFSAGPFSETINKGELLFIVGGNGSGKSTFLKLLTGLYYPESGNIYVDDWSIARTDYPAYRNLFSVVFTDFHLFEKLYGIEHLDAQQVNVWLKKTQMQHKVKYQDGAFSSTSLSTGQRKRLAFIAAMLEEKPILVIDEFAADQDPQFRQYFYETLLLEIKASGKTVIAVTHDDHYFHVADRILKMEEGRLLPYEDARK